MDGFHEVRFPLDISLHGRGGPERKTDIVMLGSGREQRNARWARSRRRYEAGYGVKTLAVLSVVIAFFEERRGRLYGFRWRDRSDYTSGVPGASVTPLDQGIGQGDGTNAAFQLIKTYGASFAPYAREILKPVQGTVRVAVAGVEKTPVSDFTVETTSGTLTFTPMSIPPAGAAITAGYLFDVPVRFDTDYLEIDLAAFEAGEIPKIPLIELLD
jgi:uncharacterized protein (TIGR02217 family)